MSAAALTPDRSPSRWLHRGGRVLLGALGVALVLALWQLAPRLGWVNPRTVPPFSDVITALPALFSDPGFARDLADSAVRWVYGITLAVVLGVLIGSLMGRSRTLFLLLNPLLVILYAVPKAALVLILVLFVGPGQTAMLIVIVAGAMIPIVVSAYHAMSGIERTSLWAARGLGWRGLRLWSRLLLPASAPGLVSGLRIAIPISLLTLIASELLIRRGGVGSFLFTMLDAGQYRLVWAATLCIACVGFLLDLLLASVARALLPWHRGDF